MSNRLLPCLLLALAASACAPENSFSGADKSTSEFDTSTDWQPPVDTDGEENSDDSGGGVVIHPSYCDERILPAEAVAQDAECEGGPAQPDWDLEVLWETQIGSGTYSPPVVGQLDDDDGDGDVDEFDIPDIIVLDTSANLYSINGADGSTNWVRATVNTTNVLSAVGDLNGDGMPDVLTDIQYTLVALDGSTGSTIWTGPSASGKNKGTCGAVGMSDLDGDGDPEAYIGSRTVNGVTGSLRGNGAEGDGLGVGNSYGHSIAADLDGDGLQEIVVGNAAYDADGNTIWANGGPDGTVAVADLDLDGSPEVVSVSSYGVSAMDSGGNEIWSYDLGGAMASTPVIADLNGDTYPEVIIPSSTSLFAIDGDGDEFWTLTPGGSASGRGGASAYDLDGDGDWEVIWAGPSATMVVDGDSGDVLTEYAGSNTTCSGPVPVVDLDGDDHAEIVVISSDGKLRALRDSNGFTGARTQWHQSDYSLTNVEDDGGMPIDPEPNWMGANNFRAGAPVQVVKSLYPVIRDVCSEECAQGSAWIWYSIANSGWYAHNGRVEVDIWVDTDTGPKYLTSDTFSGDVEPGMMTDAKFLELQDVPSPLLGLQIRIVGTSDPEVEDCQPSDDIAFWETDICP